MDGTNEWDNLVRVGPKLHKLLYLLLYGMGHKNQIFTVALIMNRYDMPKTRMIRRAHSGEKQRAIREARRKRLIWSLEEWDE